MGHTHWREVEAGAVRVKKVGKMRKKESHTCTRLCHSFPGGVRCGDAVDDLQRSRGCQRIGRGELLNQAGEVGGDQDEATSFAHQGGQALKCGTENTRVLRITKTSQIFHEGETSG